MSAVFPPAPTQAPAPSWVARVALRDFRSYIDQSVEVGAGPVVVTGENGTGKTNLLEALSLLSHERGLRGVTLSEVGRRGGPGTWAVAARIEADGPVDVG